MRRLALLALLALVAFPLSAHGRWRRPRREVAHEDGFRGSYRRWDDDRWERRDHARYRRYDCDQGLVLLRPLPTPPFQGRVDLWLH